jgi:hypothetical protein
MLYHFFIAHPEDFASRSSHISILEPAVNGGDLWGTLGKTFSISLLKYNFWGDQNWRHNYPPIQSLIRLSAPFSWPAFSFLFGRPSPSLADVFVMATVTSG